MIVERPILFSTEMVKAILDGRKTQTRRVVKPQPSNPDYVLLTQQEGEKRNNGKHQWGKVVNNLLESDSGMFSNPYGKIGDILWVKETYYPYVIGGGKNFDLISYKANGDPRPTAGWKPSLFMPKLACRLKLRITNIRCERLNDISEEDAIKEGWQKRSEVSNDPQVHQDAAKDWFSDLWESINGKGSWEKNPFVWVIEFERVIEER